MAPVRGLFYFMKPEIIFSDFDGTLTDHTEFSCVFVDIINLCHEKEVPFVIVTGRSLSWAHFFLTHFSKLTYVISEGGGCLSVRGSDGNICDEYLIDDEKIRWLEKFSAELTKRFSDVRLSVDSIGRVTDRAMELGEIEDEEVRNKITKLMDKEGINYSTSNVHLNFWAGDVSKYNAVKYFVSKYFPECSVEQTMFFGDSLNDQSMFQHIEHSVGVSNIDEVLDQLRYRPTTILEGEKNRGAYGVYSYLSDLLK
jgi:HAD superfamily hydrolase (TIGR01484 family)